MQTLLRCVLIVPWFIERTAQEYGMNEFHTARANRSHSSIREMQVICLIIHTFSPMCGESLLANGRVLAFETLCIHVCSLRGRTNHSRAQGKLNRVTEIPRIILLTCLLVDPL